MENVFLAEMANTADYSAMNYGELLATKNAINWAMANIMPLLPKRRLEEMSKITHTYVTAMNGYLATKEEILACIDKEDMGTKPASSSIPDDVDDQDATATTSVKEKKEEDNTKGEALITTPEPPVSIQDDIDVNAHMAALLESASKSEEADETNSMASSSEEEDPIDANSPEMDERANTMSVERAIEEAKSSKTPNGVDINAPYYSKYTFNYDVINEPVLRERYGNNMTREHLEEMKKIEGKFVKYYRGATNLISTEDALAYMTSDNKIEVVIYHTAGVSSSVEAKEKDLPDSEMETIETMRRAMKKAVKETKKHSVEGDANSYYCDKYIFKNHSFSGVCLSCSSRSRHYVDDLDTLVDMKAVLEEYAKLIFDNPKIISTDDCVAVMNSGGVIYIAAYNIPTPKKAKRTKKVRKDNVAPVVETKVVEPAPVEEDDPLIKEAVELAMSSPIPNGIDANGSYFIQHTFDVMKNGELAFKGKMFGDNVDADMLESTKMRHMNYASTMKGSHITSTADYTAFIELGGKRVNVYLYHTPGTKNNN